MKNWIRTHGVSQSALMGLNRMLKKNGIDVPPGKKTYFQSLNDYAFPVEVGNVKTIRMKTRVEFPFIFLGFSTFLLKTIIHCKNPYR